MLTPRTRAKTGTHVDRAAAPEQQHAAPSKPHSAPHTHRSRTGAESRSGSPVPCLDDFLPFPFCQTPRSHLGARVCSHGVSQRPPGRPNVLGGWGGAGGAAAAARSGALGHGRQPQPGESVKQAKGGGAAPRRRKLSAQGQLAPLNMAGLQPPADGASTGLQALPALPRATAKLQHRCTDAAPWTYAAAVTAPGAVSPASVAASQVLKSITSLPILPPVERCSSPHARGEPHTGVQVELDTLTHLLDQLVTEEQQRYCWPGQDVEFRLIMQTGAGSGSGMSLRVGDGAALRDRTFLTSVPEAPDKAALGSSSSQQPASSSRSAAASNLPLLPTASCHLQSPRTVGMPTSRSTRLAPAAEGVPDLTIQGGPTATCGSDLARLLPPIGVAVSSDLTWAKRVKLAEDTIPAGTPLKAESSLALKQESSHATSSDACTVKQQDSRNSLGYKAAWEANIKRSLRESAPTYQDLMKQLTSIQRLPTCGSQRTSRYLQQLRDAQRGPGASGLGALAASPEQMRQLSCDATPLLDTLACLPDLHSVMAESALDGTGCKTLRSSLNWKVTPPAYKLPQIGSSLTAPDV